MSSNNTNMFSSLFTQVFDIGYGQLCNYLDDEDICSMFKVNKECAETVAEFLKSHRPRYLPVIPSLSITEDNYLEIKYHWDSWFDCSIDTPTFMSFYSDYETCEKYCHCRRCKKLGRPQYHPDTDWDNFDFTEAVYFEEPFDPEIKYYLKIEQKDDTIFYKSLDKGHYYSLMIQFFNLKLTNIRVDKENAQQKPKLWSDLFK